MRVKELRELLEDYDDEAEVKIMSQSNYPFEYSIKGVIQRNEFQRGEDEDGGDGSATKDDVFILEGEQLCYGNKKAWGY